MMTYNFNFTKFIIIMGFFYISGLIIKSIKMKKFYLSISLTVAFKF